MQNASTNVYALKLFASVTIMAMAMVMVMAMAMVMNMANVYALNAMHKR